MFKRNAAIVLVAALVLGVGSYAWAQGAPAGPSPAGAQAQPAARHKGGGMGPVRRAVHGELVVKVKGGQGFENVAFDKGQLVSHSANSVTVKRADTGAEVTKTVNADTKFRGVSSADQLKDGQGAIVVYKGDTAVAVGQRSGAPKKK